MHKNVIVTFFPPSPTWLACSVLDELVRHANPSSSTYTAVGAID